MAAVLVAGPGAALSHRSAAALWGLRPSAGTWIEVTAPRQVRSHRGMKPHRRSLLADEVTEIRGIPVTTVPRTLLDLAAVLPRHQVERAMNEAEVRRLTDALSAPALLARYPGWRGVAVIRAILEHGQIGSTVTRSELEERFLAFVDRYGLPRPEVNVHLPVAGGWIEVDCVWREQRLVIELDGWAFHRGPVAYERDRARDRALGVAGWRAVRVTWRQLHEGRARLAADLRRLLARHRDG